MKDKPYQLLIQQSDSQLSILVKPKLSKRKHNMLLGWLILWILSGGFVISFLFAPISSDQKLMLAVWIFFWLYFAVKGYNIFWWKTKGYESITIQGASLTLLINSNRSGSEKLVIPLSQLEIRAVDFTSRRFSPQVNESFFSLGEETIILKSGKIEHRYGKQLRKEDAEKVVRTIRKLIR